MAAIEQQRLAILQSWRAALGADLLRRATAADAQTLAATVDRTIERCLALRLCADRGIIPADSLLRLTTAADTVAGFEGLSRRLFGQPALDRAALSGGENTLRQILAALAQRPGDDPFAALPIESLGTFHEQFHDLPLQGTRGWQRTAEDRSRGRKASGAYYTPAALAEYLVRRALGPLLADQTPAAIRDLTILDPACGGGIFLLTAYRLLLRWYHTAYAAAPPRYGDRLRVASDGTTRLTAAARRRILRDHIYGVDRDAQALETTRLTLLMQCYDDSPDSVGLAVPQLRANLRPGDALIGPEWHDDATLRSLRDDERAALLPLDWHATFPAIMARGGFDVAIGNPPFLSYSGRQAVAIPIAIRRYLRAHFRRAGWPAAHAYFIERAVTTLARRRIAFVVPDQVGHLAGYAPTRALLSGLVEARYWGEEVFAGALTPILTFVADKEYRGAVTIIEQDDRTATVALDAGEPWHSGADTALIAKICRDSESLGALVGDVGVHSGNCARHLIVPLGTALPDAVPILEGKAVGRYRCAAPERALRRDYTPAPGEYRTIRPEGRYREATFVIRQTAPRPIVGPRRHATYFRNSLLALYPPRDGRAIEYLVGLLNSRLMSYVYATLVREGRQRTFPQMKIAALRRLPIRRLDLAESHDRERHDAIVSAVRQLLALHERLELLTDTVARDRGAGEIGRRDRQLDRLIYDLYELDESEIAIIERHG